VPVGIFAEKSGRRRPMMERSSLIGEVVAERGGIWESGRIS
jgi:hypothetical protein